MLKIGLLGIGNAGNQIANLAIREGIKTFCINTSEKDLATVDEAIPVFLFGEAEGAGKDRSVAKSFVKRHYKDLIGCTDFEHFINETEVVFIAASAGGGTGSGVSIILTDILSRVYTNKLFINIGILPTLAESVGAQRNTLEYFKELKKMDKPYMLYDNDHYKDLVPSEYMIKVNTEIINDILYLRGDYNYQSSFGMIDDADMFKLLTVPGMLNVSFYEKFMEKDMEEDTKLDSFIIKAMKNNATVTLDKDRIIKRMGVIVNLSPDLTRYYSPSMETFKANVGEPFEFFEHYFVNDKADTSVPNRIAVILAGLSIPDDRINIILQRIRELEEALAKKKESSVIDQVSSLDSLKVDSISIDRSRSDEKVDIGSMDFDFLDDY